MERNRVAIILRFWKEDNPCLQHGEPAIRASLQLANSEQIYYFSSLEEMLDFLQKLAGEQLGIGHPS